MKTTDEKKAFLQGLENLTKKRTDERQRGYLDKKSSIDKSSNLAKGDLDKDVMKVKGSGVPDMTPEKIKVGKMDKIDTMGEKVPVISGDEFVNKQRSLEKQRMLEKFKKAAESGDTKMMNSLREKAGLFMKAGSKGLKALPIIGTLASLAGASDASAAIPLLDTADSVGMSPEDENQLIAETQGRMDYQDSPAKRDRIAALAKLLKSNN